MFDLFTGQNMEAHREFSKFEKCNCCKLCGWCRGCPAVAAGYTGNRYAPDLHAMLDGSGLATGGFAAAAFHHSEVHVAAGSCAANPRSTLAERGKGLRGFDALVAKKLALTAAS